MVTYILPNLKTSFDRTNSNVSNKSFLSPLKVYYIIALYSFLIVHFAIKTDNSRNDNFVL